MEEENVSWEKNKYMNRSDEKEDEQDEKNIHHTKSKERKESE